MKIGILGGGQLGQMMAWAAHPLGIQTTVLDPAANPCAAPLCSHIRGEFDDLQALYALSQVSDAITYEFENVPIETARWLAERVPVYPPPRALEVSQDRIVEKTFFQSLHIPTPPFAAVDSRADFDAAITRIGLPAVTKTRRFGYDGKGQAVIRTPAEAEAAWASLSGRPLILEGFVPFVRELSSLAVRSQTGEIKIYPLVENEHRDGMLHKSVTPVQKMPISLQYQACAYIERVLKELNYVGVLAIEWFDIGGNLIANEMAPRVHNSGHLTIEGNVTSQFENHMRAVAGLPLGATDLLGHSVMFNLIGDHPPFVDILKMPRAKLHWYGKDPRPRRKIGHVTFLVNTLAEREAVEKEWNDIGVDTSHGSE